MTPTTISDYLSPRTAAAAEELVHVEGKRLRCLACGHRCLLGEGREGICKVRYVRDGVLHVPRGYVAALQVDPIEKKPFYHAFPGTAALSFGMLGCDLHCSYCQNWDTSQAIRDPAAGRPVQDLTPEDIVAHALDHRASAVVSTYNEPLITSEWAVEVFQRARAAGLETGYVSNGNATQEVLDYLRPHASLYKVDLKGFRERSYRDLGGTLDRVLRTIEDLVERDFWVEIVTLVIPGFNDSPEELRDIARFVAGVSVDIPWHVTAFHQDYKMVDRNGTPADTLLAAARIGREAGLRYVYAGNLPGAVEDFENTRCPDCRRILIARRGFRVTAVDLDLDRGACPDCGCKIPGRWQIDERARGSSPGRPRPV